MTTHDALAPSAWVQRWSHLVAPGATVLDVACGHGRHMQWFAARGHAVLGLDRSAEALAVAAQFGQTLQADIEGGPWPLLDEGRPRRFGAVVVTNYLWRALLPIIAYSVAPGGVLIYETFAAGNESVGKPSRPEFLLHSGELLQACAGMRVVAFEDGTLTAPERFVQRIAAIQPESEPAGEVAPARYAL